jgi:hypothetical protein
MTGPTFHDPEQARRDEVGLADTDLIWAAIQAYIQFLLLDGETP